ncbi:ABC transporter permease [Brevibacillus sp. B_LB10_24]|uniref:ABC transporter permease n=1 Tax=Brevibacillus sp. B_LB10_24 TaxID=3380645 RepID=UPI0038BAA6F9
MNYLFDHPEKVLGLFGEHLYITAISLGIALIIAIPLGLLVVKFSKLYVPVTGFLGLVYTIPSLALFAILIPITGLGSTTAIVGLIAYSQMILVRNVVAAIRGIDPLMLEAARAMGMNKWQMILKIEIPLALPVVVAGIRIAAVSIISIATVAAWINAGGLGTLIFEGIYRSHSEKIIAGTVTIALLAIAADLLFRLIEKWLRPNIV